MFDFFKRKDEPIKVEMVDRNEDLPFFLQQSNRLESFYLDENEIPTAYGYFTDKETDITRVIGPFPKGSPIKFECAPGRTYKVIQQTIFVAGSSLNEDRSFMHDTVHYRYEIKCKRDMIEKQITWK